MTVALDLDGVAALPRSNGELVFAEPWEGRAFGLVMSLTDSGVLSYDDFRLALVDRITAWEADPPAGEDYRYYRCWLQALEQVLARRALVTADDIAARATAFSTRPVGHDHGHEHGHDHDHGHDGHGHG